MLRLVDSRPFRLDDERAMRRFTPRNPRSLWPRINKGKAAHLTELGRMAPAGVPLVEAAQASGAWTIYDEIEDLVIPDDRSSALAHDDTARTFFENFPASSQKNILRWIKSARTAATRSKRIL